MKRTALLLTMVMALVMIFAFSGCSFDATLTQGTFVEGTFVEDLLVKSYNIDFVVNDVTTTVTCKQGLVPTAPAVEGYETDSKSYTFIGWDKEIVAATEDTTYTAVFAATTKLFDVTFAYGEGKSDTVKLHWGAEPEAPTSGLNYKTDDKVYTFIGWDKEIVPVEGEVVYTAQYEESAREYNVYFVYGDGTYDVVKVAYGTVPTAPAEVPTIETNEKIYTFKGWDAEIVAVTGDAEYYAEYESTPREFTITFIYDGKTETATMKYGETVVLPTPAGYSDATGTYVFKAWDKEAAPVSGDATYTAEYTATSKVLYSQDFNDKDFNNDSTAARYDLKLDDSWTINLMANGAYAKTAAYANDPSNKYVVAGLLATNNAGTAQLSVKGKGLAAMGDFTKVTISMDLASVDGVKVANSYIRTRSTTNKYYKFFETFNSGVIKFNGVDIEGVTINTTMQTFTFVLDFGTGTATLLVDGVEKYTGAMSSTPADLGTTTYAEYIAKCTAYTYQWAIDKNTDETALCIDNHTIVAHN